MLFFSRNDLWNQHYWDHGPIYFQSHICRIVIGLYLVITFLITGKIACQKWKIDLHNVRSPNLICFTVGSSLFGIFFWFLLHLSLLYTVLWAGLWLLFIVVTLNHWQIFFNELKAAFFTEVLTYFNLNSWRSFYKEKIATLALAVVLIKLFLWKGLFPETILFDMYSHYFSFYLLALEKHSIWQAIQWWLPFYFQKGSSLQFFIVAVSDVQSLQLVGFIFFSAMLVCIYDFLIRFLTKPVTLLLIILFTASPFVLDGGFQKIHLVFGPMLILIYNLISQSCFMNNVQLLRLSIWPTLYLSLMLPLTAALTLPIYAAALILEYASNNRIRMILILKIMLSTLVAVCFVLCLNYYLTGLFDYFPAKQNLKLANPKLFDWWLNPISIIDNRFFDGGETIVNIFEAIGKPLSWRMFAEFFTPDYFIVYLKEFAYLIALVPLLIISVYFRLLPLNTQSEVKRSLLILCMLFGITFTASYGSSSDRLLFFTYVFRLLIVSAAIYILLKKFPINRKLATVFYLVLLAFSIVNLEKLSEGLDAKHRAVSYFSGNIAYGEIFSGHIPFYQKVAKIIEKDQRIMELSFCYNCHSMPGLNFEHPLMPSYNVKMLEILYGDPEEVKKILQKYKINFLFFNQDSLILFNGFSKLFSPSYLPKYYKMFYSDPPNYILTWRSDIIDSSENLPQDFMKIYSERWNAVLAHGPVTDILGDANYVAYMKGLQTYKDFGFKCDSRFQEALVNRTDLIKK